MSRHQPVSGRAEGKASFTFRSTLLLPRKSIRVGRKLWGSSYQRSVKGGQCGETPCELHSLDVMFRI